jgi:hypothetical protein
MFHDVNVKELHIVHVEDPYPEPSETSEQS